MRVLECPRANCLRSILVKQAVWDVATICPRPPCDLDLLTLKMVSESRVSWATSVPILVSLGLSVLDLGSTYATDDRQTSDVRQTSDSIIALCPLPIRDGA